jgi:peptidoglycan/xylan/chitin deacetylase (PgdA/CDA1 family)
MSHLIALTVDLEPDWGIRGTRAFREVTPRFLRFLEDRGMAATFFVVGELCEAAPSLPAAIAERNEVASHGLTHRPLSGLEGSDIHREVAGSRRCLREAGCTVRGFRAPFFRRCPGFWGYVEEAGYGYDASMGSVVPGPHNKRLGGLGCPHRRGSLYEFPTSAMGRGMLPLSLTWLRVLAPLSERTLPRRASMIYLHLHEFLPADTAGALAPGLRSVLTRNCGEAAWDILDRALSRMDGSFVPCREILESLAAGTPQDDGSAVA